MLAGWVCVLMRSDLGEFVQAVISCSGLTPLIMLGAEFVPFLRLRGPPAPRHRGSLAELLPLTRASHLCGS